ncbi:MAG TPA: alpha/beta hydrolase [Stellaceae bacterium]|nr:alpha/beta hydrolase [Stellaceae bacterium]
MDRTTITIAGAEIEVFDSGGPAAADPILYLHAGRGFRPDRRYVGLLAERHRLVAPSHPGFGGSSLPDWLDAVDDVAYLTLELVERLGLDRVGLVGSSLGGWIAAEIAAKTPAWLNKLVLVAPVGVKLGPPDRLDIPDIFAMPQEELHRLLHHDPEAMREEPSQMSDADLRIMIRNWETLALLCWEPYMHNPKLPHRLHRVRVPTLLLRGAGDGLVSADYVAGYARLFPAARVETIASAGHLPQLEQPEAFAAKVLSFLEG